MSSGVMVNSECQNAFQQLSEGKRFRYIIYKIVDREVIVEVAVPSEDIGSTGNDSYDDNSKAAYETFVKDLKERTEGFVDCRYAVFDFKFQTQRPGAGTSKMDKIVFIQLCPDGASIKKKMLYASSASAIKTSLGTAKILQFQLMSVGLSSIVDDSHHRQQNQCWAEILPAGVDQINDISGDAIWTLSSCKEGLGVHQLLNDREDTYWQSDGLQPHSITIEFQRKTEVDFLLMYLDYKLDESYTPSKIQVQTGASVLDLDEPKSISFTEPSGWQLIDLRHAGTKRPAHVFVIVVQIIQNHQNGRDTHIRGLKVLGSSNPNANMNRRALARNDDLAQYLSDPYFFTMTFSTPIR